MKVVIMAGGKGTRFWPRSVDSKPKQFLALTSQKTMLQLTYDRFLQWLPESSIYVVTTHKYSALVEEQLPDLDKSQLILEPDQRDTGPCIALTAMHFLGIDDDEVLVTTPSDQYIPDGNQLKEALLQAEELARSGRAIVTLGIVPSRAETGYGYMKTAKSAVHMQALTVEAFIEKPSEEKANEIYQESNIYWNSGIFIWKPSTIEFHMMAYQPQLWSMLTCSNESLASIYPKLPRISIDYAIMEKADTIYTIPVNFDWDDVGSWTSLERMHQKDSDGNIVIGSVCEEESKNNIIYTENVATIVIGVDDLIIISTAEGLLVCHKSKEQHIKHVLKSFESQEGGSSI